MTVEIFDAPLDRPCAICGAMAICELPPLLKAKQTDGTTHVCHPLHGGCNHGFAAELRLRVTPDREEGVT